MEEYTLAVDEKTKSFNHVRATQIRFDEISVKILKNFTKINKLILKFLVIKAQEKPSQERRAVTQLGDLK